MTVAPVPQLAHFEATSSPEGLGMDHWALSMIKESEQAHSLQQTPLPSSSWRSAPRSFSGDVHACRLLILLLRGRFTSTGIQRSRGLAAGAGGTFRCR